jgi:hypothetical protein
MEVVKMAHIGLGEDRAVGLQRRLEEVELLRDINAAGGEIERGEGVEQEEAKRLAHEGLLRFRQRTGKDPSAGLGG